MLYIYMVYAFAVLDSFEAIMGSVLGILTNGTILSQIIIYQKPQIQKEKKVK